MERLLDAGADKEKVTNQGAKPLHLTAGQGRVAVAQCSVDARSPKRRRST